VGGEPPVQIHFARVLKETPIEGANPKIEITRDSIARVLRYALAKQIRIINFSFSTGEELYELEAFLKANKMADTLFISAAGNEGGVLAAGSELWPAVYGGELQHAPDAAFVTVGAYRADGEAFSRSNRGASYVDILAPGCSITVPDLNETPKNMSIGLKVQHGTSFAAPIVSFVSALLMSEGLGPYEIKRRLVLSAEHSSKLGNYAGWGAKLDPVAALSVYHDVVELNDKEILRGYFLEETLSNVLNTCDPTDNGLRKVKDLLRLDREEVGTDGVARVNFYFKPGSDNSDVARFDRIPCLAETINKIVWRMKRLETGETTDVDLRMVRRIVMRSRFYEE
jgi:hypothetical protein